MKALLGILILVFTITLSAQIAWVNEFHYDNNGDDTGEFIEVFVSDSVSDLSSITLSLYNGGTGAVYDSKTLDLFTTGEVVNGFGRIYSYSFPEDGIQNGAPDGWSLSNSLGVIEFLSYEGSLVASAGPASGMTASSIGKVENSSTPIGASIGRTGTGSSSGDFSWNYLGRPGLDPANPGFINNGQTFIPEPSTYALIFGSLALGVVFWKRSRDARQATTG